MQDDRKLRAVSGSAPLGGYLVLGASLTSLGVDGIERRDIYGHTFTGEDSLFDDRETAVTLGVAGRIPLSISLGVRARYLTQRIDDTRAHGFGVDLGGLWRPSRHLSIGLSARHIGSRLRWGTGHTDRVLPRVQAGVAGLFLDTALVIELDAGRTLKQPVDVALGVGYTLLGIIGARAGVATSVHIPDRVARLPDISLGVSLRYWFFGVDYSLKIPVEDVGLFHRFSLVLRFGEQYL
jgi:hypothetical protein